MVCRRRSRGYTDTCLQQAAYDLDQGYNIYTLQLVSLVMMSRTVAVKRLRRLLCAVWDTDITVHIVHLLAGQQVTSECFTSAMVVMNFVLSL